MKLFGEFKISLPDILILIGIIGLWSVKYVDAIYPIPFPNSQAIMAVGFSWFGLVPHNPWATSYAAWPWAGFEIFISIGEYFIFRLLFYKLPSPLFKSLLAIMVMIVVNILTLPHDFIDL